MKMVQTFDCLNMTNFVIAQQSTMAPTEGRKKLPLVHLLPETDTRFDFLYTENKVKIMEQKNLNLCVSSKQYYVCGLQTLKEDYMRGCVKTI